MVSFTWHSLSGEILGLVVDTIIIGAINLPAPVSLVVVN